jgi:Holliday junction resolvasome RuvABC ATP-dependent DNA helicase subunit
MISLPYSLGVIATLLVLFAGYAYYSESKIEQLVKANTQLEQINAQNAEAISQLERDIKSIYELNNALKKDLDKADETKRTLSKTLSNHNLTRLSIEKPGLIEKRINDATAKKFTALEEYTRSLSNSNSDRVPDKNSNSGN